VAHTEASRVGATIDFQALPLTISLRHQYPTVLAYILKWMDNPAVARQGLGK